MQNTLKSFRQMPVTTQFLVVIFLVIMALMPLHGFISTWLGTLIGPLLIWKAWKEILFGLAGLLAVVQIVRNGGLREWLKSSMINKLILIYVIWQIFTAVFADSSPEALLMGLIINLRIVLFFVYAQIVFYYYPQIRRVVPQLLLWPLILVVAFGILQMTVLPKDFLANFGYDKNLTIAPYNTIDGQADTLRIQSTLRGPNPLGAYLVLPILLLFSLFWRKFEKTGRPRMNVTVLCLLLAGSAVVMYGAHSRSAWVGLFIAMIAWILLKLSKKLKLAFLIGSVVLVAISAFGVITFRDNRFVQDVILHDNPDSGPADTTNSIRLRVLQSSAEDITKRPLLGCAPGCAGPASFHNDEAARLSENYYLQVGQETGLIGMGLFLAIIMYLIVILYKQRHQPEAKILLGSLIGLSAANLFLHVWADDTLAYVWWGIAGLWYGQAQLSQDALSDKPENQRRGSRRVARNRPKS